jgi:hypothetical protein
MFVNNPYVTEELLRQGEQERRRRARRDAPTRQFRRRRRGGLTRRTGWALIEIVRTWLARYGRQSTAPDHYSRGKERYETHA